MKSWLRENVAVVIGVSLPVVVVVLFVLARYLPMMLVAPPQYDLLLTMQGTGRQRPVRVEIAVVDHQLRVRLFGVETPQPALVPAPMYPMPRLFVWSHEDRTLREVEISLPDDLEHIDPGQEVLVPELANREISTAARAPDGYEFRNEYDTGAGIFTALFGGGSRRVVLEKSGAIVPVDLPSSQRYWGFEFLGWVVE